MLKSESIKKMVRLFGSGKAADWQKVFAVIVVWGGAVVCALSRITVSSAHMPPIWRLPGYQLEHGYTYSLILLYLPLAALTWWYLIARRSDTDRRLQKLMGEVLRNAAITSAIFVAFDAVFATLL